MFLVRQENRPLSGGFDSGCEKLGFVKLGVFAWELGDRPVATSMFLPLGSIPMGP